MSLLVEIAASRKSAFIALVAGILVASAGAQTVTLSLTSLSFGNVVLGTTSVTKGVTLKNGQTVPLSITNIAASIPDFTYTTNCPTMLVAGASCTISVSFRPASLGLRSGSLSITHNAASSPQAVALSGSGVQPVSLTSGSVSFGSQVIGTASSAITVTLWNNQALPLSISGINTTLADYATSSTCPTFPNTLAARSSCSISVKFTPTVLGFRQGTLTVADNASSSPQTVVLKGTGIAPVTLIPTTLWFANQAKGTTSSAQSITLKNNQSSALIITSIASSLSDFGVSSNCPLSPTTVVAGASCMISITFRPTVTGTRSGKITVIDSASNSPQAVSVSGYALPPVLVSLSVTPSATSVALGKTKQFNATGTFTDGSTKTINYSAIWSSSTPAVATVNTGLATTGSQGATTITATSGSVSGSASLTVTAPVLISLSVTPASSSVPLGKNAQLSAIGTYTDGSTKALTSSAVWSSSATAIATISGGLTSTLSQGSTTISATFNKITGSASLTVLPPAVASLSLAPGTASLPLGASLQMTAMGTFTDGSTQDVSGAISWSSSAQGILSITNAGLATGSGMGTATITGTSGSITSSATVAVGQPALVSIAITAPNNSLALGTSEQLKATGTYTDGSTLDLSDSVTWTSGSSGVATVNNRGLATSVAVGSTSVTATSGSIIGSKTVTVSPAVPVSVAVTPAVPSTPLGTKQQFTATGTFTDGTTQDITQTVQWSVDNESVATVNNVGGTQVVATTVGTGTTNIIATSGSVKGSTTLTVTPAALVSIAVAPATPSISLGTNLQFTATGTFTDGSTKDLTKSVTWTSDTPTTATIDQTGKCTSSGMGTAMISATSDSLASSSTLIVTAAALASIAIDPPTATIPLGTTQQFTATGTFTDGTTQDLTQSAHWSSSAASVATVSNSVGMQGLATSVGTGVTTIAISSGLVNGSATLTVSAAALVSISLTPQTPNISLGQTQQFTAIGSFTDGTTKDVTSTISWSSSAATVAVISNASGSSGLATTAGLGAATISASSGSVSTSTTLTVGEAAFVSISIAPASPTIPLGATQQLLATATLSDGTILDITNSATWTTSVGTVAGINATGLLTTLSVGSTTISAASGSLSGSTTLSVTAPVPQSLVINPVNPSIAWGGQQQFSASMIYSDGSSQDVTGLVTWTSSATSVATVSSGGLARATGSGTSTIHTASGSGGMTSATTLTVAGPGLVSLSVSPSSITLQLSEKHQYAATGTYADGSTLDVTNSVNWSSSDPTVASATQSGLVTSMGFGVATITATSSSVSGSTSVTTPFLPTVPNNFFGMHKITPGWPSANFGVFRLWDSGTRWSQIETASGVYNWTTLDSWLATMKAHGIDDVMFTFAGTPAWASSNPTDTFCDNGAGGCYLPGDINLDGRGTNQTLVAAITAIATHVNDPTYLQTHAHIRSWEPWNEFYRDPLLGYSGTPPYGWSIHATYAQMVRITEDFRCAIRGKGSVNGSPCTATAIDPNATITTPSSPPRGYGRSVMENFLNCDAAPVSGSQCSTASRGSAAIDVLNWHYYETSGKAEDLLSDAQSAKALLRPADAAKPAWNSEGGWGLNTNLSDIDMQVAFVARYYLLGYGSGLARMYWYEWDNSGWGTMWRTRSGSGCTVINSGGFLCPAGTAYNNIHDWLVGSVLGACTASGNIWTCPVTRPGGYQALVVWDTSRTCSAGACTTSTYVPGSQYIKYRDLNGNTTALSGSSVPIGAKPIILENQ